MHALQYIQQHHVHHRCYAHHFCACVQARRVCGECMHINTTHRAPANSNAVLSAHHTRYGFKPLAFVLAANMFY